MLFFKPKNQKAIGIDLGTSRSGIAAATVDKEKGLDVQALAVGEGSSGGESYRIPSVVVCSKTTGKYLLGEAARQQAGSESVRTFASAKSDVDSDSFYFDGIGSIFVKPANVLGEILSALRQRASKHLDLDPRTLPASIAVPASLPYQGRKEIMEAARRAGWELKEGNLVEEPVAVLLDAIFGPQPVIVANTAKPVRVAVYDIGAGTCDVAIFELDAISRNGSGPNVRIKTLALGDYDRLGGDNFDIEIARKALLPQIAGGRQVSAEEVRLFVKQNRYVARTLKEELCRQIEKAIERTGHLAADVAPMRYPSLEVAGRTVTVGGTDAALPAGDVVLTTESMVSALKPFLSLDADEGEIVDGRWVGSLLEPLEYALEESGIDPETDLYMLILSGASCRAPFVPYLIATYCSDIGISHDKIRLADLDLSVERGAAIHAGVLASTGKAPADSVLGEDIGLWVYGNRPEPIVKAGTVLPYPASGEQEFTDTFFVPEDNLDRVVVELYARTRKLKRKIIRKSFDIPKGTPAGAQVLVKFRIDNSKMIHLKAVLADQPDVGLTFHGEDVLISGRHSEEEQWVKSAREKVRNAIETTGTPPLSEMLDLAHGEGLCHNETSFRKSHEILDHVIEQHPKNARAWNILGLVRWNESDLPGAERAFRKAMSLDPDTRVHRANLGHVLHEMGRPDDAIHVLRAAHTRWPDYPCAAELYARTLEAAGQYQEAHAVRTKTIATFCPNGVIPADVQRYDIAWLLRLYEGTGDSAKVDELYKHKNLSATPPTDTSAQPYREALLAGPESPAPSGQAVQGRLMP
ncbi:MAG: hypothetical protein A3I06_09405 [Candidatus Lindowbacteria bacterium RIFCSPLOWO2_02_FULL_62_12]|nr:MAG: hypothetical protein A3I06_09405 [Candidatus Lindowbacteria bacterium RIFCSPLOWO2_02_FULL_62_12]